MPPELMEQRLREAAARRAQAAAAADSRPSPRLQYGPEDLARLDEAARSIERSTSPNEIIELVDFFAQFVTPEPSQQLGGAMLRLSKLGVLAPTHDHIVISRRCGYKKGYEVIEGWEEISREPAWFAKNGSIREVYKGGVDGFGGGATLAGTEPCDAWLSADGSVWVLGGHGFVDDNGPGGSGRSNQLDFVVPHGAAFAAKAPRRFNSGNLFWYRPMLDVTIHVGQRVRRGSGAGRAITALLAPLTV